jgi:hypothetical protein
VVTLKLAELRLFHTGPDRSKTARADRIECSIVIQLVVERRRGGHPVGQAGPFLERLSLKDADRQGTYRPPRFVSFTRLRHLQIHRLAFASSTTILAES